MRQCVESMTWWVSRLAHHSSQCQPPEVQQDRHQHTGAKRMYCSVGYSPTLTRFLIHTGFSLTIQMMIASPEEHWKTDIKVDAIKCRTHSPHCEAVRVGVVWNRRNGESLHKCCHPREHQHHCRAEHDPHNSSSWSVEWRFPKSTERKVGQCMVEHKISMGNKIKTKRHTIKLPRDHMWRKCVMCVQDFVEIVCPEVIAHKTQYCNPHIGLEGHIRINRRKEINNVGSYVTI